MLLHCSRCASSRVDLMRRLGAEQRLVVEMLANENLRRQKNDQAVEPFSLTRQHTQQYASLEDQARCVTWHSSTFFAKRFVSRKPRTSLPRVLVLCLTSASCRGSCQLNCSRAQCPRAESGERCSLYPQTGRGKPAPGSRLTWRLW